MTKIAPSILSADFTDIKGAILMIEQAGADMVHCDVMDGMFVPNITFGIKMIADIRKITKLPLDVHLMIMHPERFIEEFCSAGADWVTVHVEATEHVHRAVQTVRKCGALPGIVLNPGTPVEAASCLLPDVDMVLLMAVNPGFGGQTFIPHTLQKIKDLKALARQMHCNIKIQVDGGINEDTAGQASRAGADILVTGSTFFTSKNPAELLRSLKNK